eukprot:TRINITY_DN48757_c0_g1_i1.p1 TRINITY_DN48757_c0_g1~~TRINITY_DN48757_c0_g1_i1.p1  ORF type:complete len:212 (+),score=46.27 TRINITY_DN48757_c0_g1_i1:116-751(+)
MKLTFVTSNQGKIDFLRIVLESLIKEGKIESLEIDGDVELIELQADTVSEICRGKAEAAYKILQRPVIVQDSGFAIAALNGFPGPYTKYVMSTIGVDGILKLMEGQTDRRCGFVACCGYADEAGKVRVFEEPETYFGHLANSRISKQEGAAVGKAWGQSSGELFEVFIPGDAVGGNGMTLAEMTEEQLTMYRRNRNSAFKVFAEWLRDNLQ